MTINTLLFDWGGTLMLEFPGMTGPMVEWPRVEAVPGAKETLAELNGRYRLAIASNARDSGRELIRQALARVDLDRYMGPIFTPREVKAKKPEPEFFANILKELGIPAEQAAMVGDSYASDILGAVSAGLRAVWFTVSGEECLGGHPTHDAEITELANLPSILGYMNYPTIATSLEWLAAEGLPENIISHSQMVARLSYRLAVWLRQAGEPVNPVLAHRGGLLHDLDKISSQQKGIEHARLSARLLAERGQPELAEIARRHLISSYGDPEGGPRSWEEKLVFYADKLVEGDRVVRFSERMAALMQRYPGFAEKILQHAPDVTALEREICDRLGLSPDPFFEQLSKSL
jgi:putative hydrolase of the HAD superfamily